MIHNPSSRRTSPACRCLYSTASAPCPHPPNFRDVSRPVYAAVLANTALMRLVMNPSLVREQHSEQWRRVTRALVDGMESVDSLIVRGVRQTCGNYDCNAWAEVGDPPVGKENDPGSAKLFWCVTCKHIKYCSKECKRADWKWHKLFCGAETIPMPENVGLGTKGASDTFVDSRAE